MLCGLGVPSLRSLCGAVRNRQLYILRMYCKGCISHNFSIFFIIHTAYNKKQLHAFSATKNCMTRRFFLYTTYIFHPTPPPPARTLLARRPPPPRASLAPTPPPTPRSHPPPRASLSPPPPCASLAPTPPPPLAAACGRLVTRGVGSRSTTVLRGSLEVPGGKSAPACRPHVTLTTSTSSTNVKLRTQM